MPLTLINMIPKVNLGVGEMGFVLCDLYISQKMQGDISSTNLPCLISVLPGDTSDSGILISLQVVKVQDFS